MHLGESGRKQVQALYDSAIALPPEMRDAFLEHACPADAELRGEVQSLLAQQADSFLENSLVSAIKTLSSGAKLANFEIVELIGRGGMGEVYRARDKRLKRDVAIKVLPPVLARDPDRIARFEREARAVGTLNHETVDYRSDLFSFGVILFEMLSGKRAFAGGASVEVMHAISPRPIATATQ